MLRPVKARKDLPTAVNTFWTPSVKDVNVECLSYLKSHRGYHLSEDKQILLELQLSSLSITLPFVK